MSILVKRILFLLCILSMQFNTIAQKQYGNEWINPDKEYLKLKVAEDGVYRVSYEEMEAAGFLRGNTNGRDFELINYGKECALFISNNTFIQGEYIEFYGEKNRNGLDSLLFKDWKKDLFNPEYSFVTDTNVYFLTLSPENNNKRFTISEPDYENIKLEPTPFYLHEEKIIYNTTYFKNIENDIRYSYFEPSEGFGTAIVANSNHTFNVSKIYTDGPLPVLTCRIGNNNQVARIEVRFNNQLLDTKVNGARANLQLEYEIGYDLLKSGSNSLNLKNIGSTTDRHRVSYTSLVYPRLFDFQNKNSYFFTLPTNNGQRFLKIDAFNANNREVKVFDPVNSIRYQTSVNNGQVLVLLNSVEHPTQYFITSESAIKSVPNLTFYKPISFSDEGTQYLIITNSVLHNTGTDYVQAFADYRSSNQGGEFKTKIIDVQSIYDYFGYGIDRHFYSFKQMSKFLHENWKELEYVFIIGKGLEYNTIRTPNDVKNKLHKSFFVPTFGYLGSDNMLLSEDNYPDPNFALGRLAAKTSDDIKNYLNKIQQYESASSVNQTIEDKYWLKKVLQLGGGKTVKEQDLIKAGLVNMATLIQDTIFGGEVHSYYKESSDPILYETNEEINRFFDHGVSLVNFFGHSSAGSWEFPIDNPRNFTNYGKYPFLNALGCYAGNLHGESSGLSESFVLEKDRGSIAFLASTGTAFIQSLSIYGQNFLLNVFKLSRGESYGKIVRKLAYNNRDALSANHALYSQITYHGDPAIRFHQYEAPDYIFDPASVKTTPTIVQGNIKEYVVNLDIINLGAYTGDTLDLICYHQLPDGTIIDTIKLKVDQVANRRSIEIPLKNYDAASLGKNTVFVTIDPENKYKELPLPVAKSNNQLNEGRGFEFYVIGNYASALYPPNFGMINTNDHFVLKGSTSTVPIAENDFIFQIDTTAYFNSPILETGKVKSTGGLMEYRPNIALVPELVYYWRLSPDSIAGEGYKWSQASFAFIPEESEGWNQSHYFQFLANDFDDIELSEDTRRQFEFGPEFHTVQLRNRLWDTEDKPGFTFDNVRYGSVTPWNFMDSGLGFIVCDRNENLSGVFNPKNGLYGSVNPTGNNVRGFFFNTKTQKDRQNIIEFIESEYKSNYYLHVFSILKNENSAYNFDGWEQDSLVDGKNLFNVLESFGAQKIRNLLRDTVPYIFQVENGNKVLAEILGTSKYDVIQSKLAVSRKLGQGSFSTTPIGRVKKWGDLKLDIPVDQFQTSALNIYSVKDNISFLKDSIPLDGLYTQGIQADDFIRLKINNSNDSTKMSPQLNYWRITYQPLPDAAIQFIKNVPDPKQHTLVQGENIQVHYRVINVNFVDMDSIRVRYTYTDNENKALIKYKVLPPLKAGKTIDDQITFSIGVRNTTDIKLTIEINPEGYQPELNYFNNTLTQQFEIKGDNDNPILQLSFDGIQIMDGDIVSSSPEIGVTLFDENDYLLITDPEAFDIKIDTGYNEFLQIDVHSPDVRFEPATNKSKVAKLYFKRTFKDGHYTLSVQGKDASGNKSGIHPRTISFNVITAKTVSNIMNYPNPFSNSTQFIFTLTGDEIPENISISIYTITGKVVREITKEQLGSLHIGVNRTNYKWDGTDDFGEKLGNGVYLYKVNFLHKDGSQFDRYANKAIDKYFKEGFGKLVILR